MSITDTVKKWILKIAFKKTIARGVTLLVAWVMSLGLNQYGLDINPEAMTAAIFLLLDNLRSWIKLKYPAIGAFL